MGVNCFGNFIFLASAYEGEESAQCMGNILISMDWRLSRVVLKTPGL